LGELVYVKSIIRPREAVNRIVIDGRQLDEVGKVFAGWHSREGEVSVSKQALAHRATR
jgi:hypothetical protein